MTGADITGWTRRFALLVLLTGLVAVTGTPARAQSTKIVSQTQTKSTKAYYAASTGHSLSDPYFSYWSGHEGMTVLGLPVTEPVSTAQGQIQYFEDGALLQATTNSAKQPSVTPIAAGRALLAAESNPDRLVAGRRVGGLRDTAAFVAQTAAPAGRQLVGNSGHTIGGAIKDYYVAQGGQARFGLPLSEPYLAGGQIVQWFEQGRLEAAASGTPNVHPAAVGLELALANGVDIAPVAPAKLPQLNLDRYRHYSGDGTLPEAVQPFSPVKIDIPAIQIDANIEQVPITNGVMGVPKNAWNVGWYPELSKPGQDTNVVMAGHKDWWGIGPTIFANLQNLAPGDKVYLTDQQGSGFTYVITSVESVPSDIDAAKIVDDTGRETLTLITCTGTFDGQEYQSRLIVRANRM